MFRMSAKVVFLQLRDFRHVRRFLTQDAFVLVANALVSSRLDYCNSLFRSLSRFNLHKLQCIQKSAARIISNTSRYTSIFPVFKHCIGFLLNIAQFLKQPPLYTSFFILVFSSILLHISLPTTVLTVSGAVTMVVISLWFQSSKPHGFAFDAPLFEMLFLMCPPP